MSEASANVQGGPDASGERHDWPSADVFLVQDKLQSGTHVVVCHDFVFEFVLPAGAASAAARLILVLFPGEDDASRPPPVLEVPVARIRTPQTSAAASGYLPGAGPDALSSLVRLLCGISRRVDADLLLVGGDAGGFLALRCAYDIGARASVLVWNPQTDLIEHDERAVRAAITHRFPGTEFPVESGAVFRQAARHALESRGVVYSMLPALRNASRPRRLLYLQNASDRQVAHQAGPFMEAAGFVDQGDGFHVGGDGSSEVWFGNWGPGHRSPSVGLIEFLLGKMLRPEWSVTQLKRDLEDGGYGHYIDPAQAPIALANRTPPPDIRLSAISNGQTLCVDVRVDGIPKGHGQITYAFYVLAGEERIAIRWYDASPHYEFREQVGKAATRIVTFVRDGFGRQLPLQVTRVVHSSGHVPALSRRRVFICGSCVSRDAFEFAGPELHLAGYIARSSLASAFDEHVPDARLHENLARIPSAFQRRMVGWDLKRSAADVIDTANWDIVLLDLIDERFSLLQIDGALVTMSGEFMKTGIRGDPERLIASGSEAHVTAWKRGFARFLDTVGAEQVVVNKVFWATHDNFGEPLERQEWISHNNATLARMYDHIERVARLRVIAYPDSLLVAEREHKWGVSPFHYTRAMYMHTLAQLGRLLE